MITLDNLGQHHLIRWEALERKLRFPWEIRNSACGLQISSCLGGPSQRRSPPCGFQTYPAQLHDCVVNSSKYILTTYLCIYLSLYLPTYISAHLFISHWCCFSMDPDWPDWHPHLAPDTHNVFRKLKFHMTRNALFTFMKLGFGGDFPYLCASLFPYATLFFPNWI